MNDKLYYDNPLCAALIAQKFGVEFELCDAHPVKKWTIKHFKYMAGWWFIEQKQPVKFVIHSDSHHIFDNMNRWNKRALVQLDLWPLEEK